MSFRLKSILGIIAIECLLLLLLAVGSLSVLRSSNEDALQMGADMMARGLAVLSHEDAVSGNPVSMTTALEEFGGQYEIAYARIKNADGAILIELDVQTATGEAHGKDQNVQGVTDGIFETSAPIIENGKIVGTAEVGLSTRFIDTLIASLRWKFLMTACVIVLATVLFGYILGDHLTRQLKSLRAMSRKIADGEIGDQVATTGDMEIANTIRVFNQMSSRLKVNYDKLLYNDRRMRSIFDNVALAAVTFDAQGTIIEFNAPAEWIFGHAAAEIIGSPISALLDKQSHVPVTSLLNSGNQPANDDHLEYQLNLIGLRKDGRRFPVEMIISQYGFDGINNYIVLMRDISNEKALEQKTAQAHSVFENMGDAIVITDAENKVVQVNPAYTRITGFDAQDVIGNARQISRAESLDHDFFATIWESLTENGIWSGEVWDTRKNGEIFPAWMTTTELTDENGEVTNYINTFRDITDSKNVERIKNEFVAIVSHELRTPVTSIKGALGILQSGALGKIPAKAAKIVDLAVNNCNRLTDLINDILDMEKIESGTVTFNMSPMDVDTFLDEAIGSCQHYGEDRGVSLTRTGEALSAMVLADKGRMIQVMANLMSNAVKYSPDDGTVHVRVTRIDGRIRISVADDGPGIPAEFLGQLFEKFTQANDPDGGKRGGSGLGLNIAKSIVDMHEGSIGFSTGEGKGTTFYVYLKELPAHSCAQEADRLAAS